MTAALGFFWLRRGLFETGKQWLDVFLPRSATPTKEEAAALYWASWIYFDLGIPKKPLEFSRRSFEKYRAVECNSGMALSLAWAGFLERSGERWRIGWEHSEESIELAIEADDPWTTVQALYFTYTRPKPNRIRRFDGDKIRAMFDDGLGRLRETGDLWGLAIGLHALGDTLTEYFDFKTWDEACAHYRESLAIFEDLNDKWMAANTLRCLATGEILRGNFEGAENSLHQAVEYFDELGSYAILPVILALSANLALRRNDSQKAARYFGAARAIARSVRGVEPGEQDPQFEQFKHIDMGKEENVAEQRKGLSMSLRQVIEFAKGNDVDGESEPSEP